jgi:hypothetical protein
MQSFFFDGNLKFRQENFKGLSPSTTPFGKRRFIRLVAFTIHQTNLLSMEKLNCENYLFEDYQLKSGRAISIHGLMTSGSNICTKTS